MISFAQSLKFTAWIVLCICQYALAHGNHAQTPIMLDGDNLSELNPQNTIFSSNMRTYSLDEDGRWTVRTPAKLNKDQLRKDLVPLELESLPLGSIRPQGWMRNELQLMADGLPGHLHAFYRIIKNGTWLQGDQEYSGLNEAWPYWFNGVVALAYGLDDERLKQEIDRVTDFVLQHQFADGWFGPEADLNRRNFWGRYPFLLGLMQLVESADASRSKIILDAVHKFVALMHDMLSDNNQGYVNHGAPDAFNDQWGRSRAADLVLFLQWLYDTEPRNNSEKILDSMVLLYESSFDWSYWFRDDVFLKGDFDDLEDRGIRRRIYPYVHVVNAGQGLKYGSVMRRFTHLDRYIDDTLRGTINTFEFHGTPSGSIIGDEGESGVLPHRGTELCSVVEAMYSLTYNYRATGNRYYADRAELAAYNALPVMVTSDWWAHQYIAQSNQPVSQQIEHPPFFNVGPFGTTFGTEPNYPCCAVNFPQGLPKFLSAAFARTKDDGIAHIFLMPAELITKLKDNGMVRISCATNYPFEHDLKYSIDATVPFDFSIRIPGWASSYTLKLNSEEQHVSTISSNSLSGLITVPIPQGQTVLDLSLVTAPRVEHRINNTISVHYGALLFALPIPAIWHGTRPARYPDDQAPPQAQDWTIIPNADVKWNIGIDPSTIKVHSRPEDQKGADLPNPVWSIDASPIRLSAMACEIADWTLTQPQGGYAPPPPPPAQRKCIGSPFEVFLQPYGALKVHMAEFPSIDPQHS